VQFTSSKADGLGATPVVLIAVPGVCAWQYITENIQYIAMKLQIIVLMLFLVFIIGFLSYWRFVSIKVKFSLEKHKEKPKVQIKILNRFNCTRIQKKQCFII
jgi:hypothetical protein